MTLDEIPSGGRVFVDSTIFIYHFTGVSVDCRQLLERCEQGDVKGISSVIVLAEVSHRLMMIEAVTRGLVSPGNLARKLREKPAIVKKLHLYQEQLERIPLMGIEAGPIDLKTLLRSGEIRSGHGFLTNDSLVAMAAVEAGVEGIASADADFSRLKSIPLFQPGDLTAGARGET